MVLRDLLPDHLVQVCSQHPAPADLVGYSHLPPAELLRDPDLQLAAKNNSFIPLYHLNNLGPKVLS